MPPCCKALQETRPGGCGEWLPSSVSADGGAAVEPARTRGGARVWCASAAAVEGLGGGRTLGAESPSPVGLEGAGAWLLFPGAYPVCVGFS